MHTVFVYGTLKKGLHNHRLLQEAEFVGTGEAPGVVYKTKTHGYPFAKPSDDVDCWIKGEVYRVTDDDLRRLDSLEGHPRFYERSLVVLRSGEVAGIYYYHHRIREEHTACQDGEWLPEDHVPEDHV